MAVTTIPQISDVLDQHSVRIDAAQSDADFAQTESARALTTIYQTGLNADIYTDAEIQRLKDELRAEFQQADDAKELILDSSIDAKINTALPGFVESYYGNAASIQSLYDNLIIRFNQSDASLDNMLNNVLPGIQSSADSAVNTANSTNTNFEALENSLKSVLVVFADDAAGTNQSLTAGSREYVRYVEYNGTPPTLPVTGTFTKFVGTPQSIWPIYADNEAGDNQSFSPGSKEWVTFYESTTQPTLPVVGATFVRYVGATGSRGAGRWNISVVSVPTTSTEAQNAWNAASNTATQPVEGDYGWFYVGTESNPTEVRVWLCTSVISNTIHTWEEQKEFIDGSLFVKDSITASKIRIYDYGSLTPNGDLIELNEAGDFPLNWGTTQPVDEFTYYDRGGQNNITYPQTDTVPAQGYFFAPSQGTVRQNEHNVDFRVEPGEQFRVTIQAAFEDGGLGADTSIEMYFRDVNGAYVTGATVSFNGETGSNWRELSGVITVPNNSNIYNCFIVRVVRKAGGTSDAFYSRLRVKRMDAASLTVDGGIEANFLKLNGTQLEGDGSGNLIIKTGGVNTAQLAVNAATTLTYAAITNSQDDVGQGGAWVNDFMVPTPWINSQGNAVTVTLGLEGDVGNFGDENRYRIRQSGVIVFEGVFTNFVSNDAQFFVSCSFTWPQASTTGVKWSLDVLSDSFGGMQNVNGALSVQVLER